MARLELTSGHAREMDKTLTEQNFGVSPLEQYAIPVSARRTPVYTIPGIPRKLMNQMIEVAVLEHALNSGYENLDFPTCRAYIPGLTSKDHDVIVKSKEFHTALVLRGIRTDTEGLSGDQMRALAIMSDISSKQPLERKLKAAGIPWYQWQTWMHSPLFKSHYDALAKKVFDSAQSSIDLKVASGALDGDLNFIKYYNELTGRHSPDRRAHADVQMILNEVVKIIQQRVQDPETLMAISTDLSAVVAKLG